jgi:hypothetical protein
MVGSNAIYFGTGKIYVAKGKQKYIFLACINFAAGNQN